MNDMNGLSSHSNGGPPPPNNSDQPMHDMDGPNPDRDNDRDRDPRGGRDFSPINRDSRDLDMDRNDPHGPPSGDDRGSDRGATPLIGSGHIRPVFFGNLDPLCTATDIEEIFFRPVLQEFNPIEVDRVDLKRGFCFVFLMDVKNQDQKDQVERYVADINGMNIVKVSKALRSEFARGDGRIKRKEDDRRKRIMPSETLFVVNFHEERTKHDDLEMLFKEYGELVRIDMKNNYAFVQFTSIENATRAKDATNGGKLDESVITVEYAAQRKGESRDYRGGRDYDRGDRKDSRDYRGGRDYDRERGPPRKFSRDYDRDRGGRKDDYPKRRDDDFSRRKDDRHDDRGGFRGRDRSPAQRADRYDDYRRGRSRSRSPAYSRYRSPSHSPARRGGRDDDRGGRGGYDEYRGGRSAERGVDRNAERGMDRGADRGTDRGADRGTDRGTERSSVGGDREYRDVRARSSERESYRAGGDSRGYK